MEQIIITSKEQLEAIIGEQIKKALWPHPLTQKEDPQSWFDIDQLRDYLPDKPVRATIYSWIHGRSIPHYKGTKKLRFLKSEIDEWLKHGRKLTTTEVEAKAETYLSTKSKNRHGR